MDEQGAQPAAPPGPATGRPRRLLRLSVIIGAVAVVCLGGTTLAAVKVGRSLASGPAASRPFFPGASAGATPAVHESTAAGPRASSHPVRTTADLRRVCDSWFYPRSPKVRAKALNPVKAFADDGEDRRLLVDQPLYDIPWSGSPATRAAWDPPTPAKVALVACADLAGTGAKVKTCKIDDPGSAPVPMVQATYNLSVYEVRTGRKVVTKQLRGEDQACPFVVLPGADRTLHSGVSDRQLFAALRKYVEK